MLSQCIRKLAVSYLSFRDEAMAKALRAGELEEVSYNEEIAEVRKKAGVSQAVFARYLNVTVGLVSQWERGEKQPRGSSLKLLALVQKRPGRYRLNS